MSSVVTTDLSQTMGLCRQAGDGHGQGRTVTLRKRSKTHHLNRLLLTHRLGERTYGGQGEGLGEG